MEPRILGSIFVSDKYVSPYNRFVAATKFNPKIHHRRSICLKGFDYCVGGFVPPTRYAAGMKPAARQVSAYFVTIVAFQRECLFGKIADGEMKLNDFGRIAIESSVRATGRRPYMCR